MRTVGYAALVAALVFVFAAIWWSGHRVESCVTALVLLVVAAAILGQGGQKN